MPKLVNYDVFSAPWGSSDPWYYRTDADGNEKAAMASCTRYKNAGEELNPGPGTVLNAQPLAQARQGPIREESEKLHYDLCSL